MTELLSYDESGSEASGSSSDEEDEVDARRASPNTQIKRGYVSKVIANKKGSNSNRSR